MSPLRVPGGAAGQMMMVTPELPPCFMLVNIQQFATRILLSSPSSVSSSVFDAVSKVPVFKVLTNADRSRKLVPSSHSAAVTGTLMEENADARLYVLSAPPKQFG